MKKLLLASSLVVLAFGWSCNSKTTSKAQTEEVTTEGTVIHTPGSENQAKLDSLKALKTKGKQ